MKIKKMMGFLLGTLVSLPMMLSCSGEEDSKSPFGSLPKVYGEFREASEKLKEESKDIKTEEEKAEYLKKTEKLTNKWSEKIEASARKLDGKPLQLADGQFTVTQPISLEFNRISDKTYLYVVFNINGSAETAEEIHLPKQLLPTTRVYIAGYDAGGEKMFSTSVGTVVVQDQDGKSVIPKGTPVKFDTFEFGKYGLEKYVNTEVMKLEVNN